MTYTMWNYLLALLLVSTLGQWTVHIYHRWQLHRLERRVKMLEEELNDTNRRLNTYIADEY